MSRNSLQHSLKVFKGELGDSSFKTAPWKDRQADPAETPSQPGAALPGCAVRGGLPAPSAHATELPPWPAGKSKSACVVQ